MVLIICDVMKERITKLLALIGVVSICAGLISGCNKVKNEVREEVQELGQDIKGDVQDMTGNNIDEAVTVTEEQAKAIALERAGLTAEEVVFTEVSLDYDDGRKEYEIEFRKDRTEYTAEISAVDGTIISWEIDND